MSAYIEACAEAGSENGLCQTNKINPFWKLASIQTAQPFEQLSSLFPLTSKNDSVFLGRLLFCKTKHVHSLRGWGEGVCAKTWSASRQQSHQRAAHRRSILAERRGAAGGSGFTILTREVWVVVCFLVFFVGVFFFFPWASISNDLFRCKQWQL